MGTPEFAVASLDMLFRNGCNIVGVIAAPDKPSGRGMKMNESSVKKYAVAHNLPILQPEKLKNSQFLECLKNWQADLQIVVAFRMLPEAVWNMPPMGTINVHGSLLPHYRGAAPINWAIINGEQQTGVTTFKLQHEIDTGNILLQQSIAIGDDETAGELHDEMKEVGAQLLLKTIQGLADGSLSETPQLISNNNQLTIQPAPKIGTETGKIDWNKTVDEVYNLIRGLSPYPTAFTFLQNKLLKIYNSRKEYLFSEENKIGLYQTDGKTFLKFMCSNGFIHATDVQLEGKKRMLIEDFLRGYRM